MTSALRAWANGETGSAAAVAAAPTGKTELNATPAGPEGLTASTEAKGNEMKGSKARSKWDNHRRMEMKADILRHLVERFGATHSLLTDEWSDWSEVRDVLPGLHIFPDTVVASYRAGEALISDILADHLNWDCWGSQDNSEVRLLAFYNGNKAALSADLEVMRREKYNLTLIVVDAVAAVPEDPGVWVHTMYHPAEFGFKKHRVDAAYIQEPFELRLYQPGKDFKSWKLGKRGGPPPFSTMKKKAFIDLLVPFPPATESKLLITAEIQWAPPARSADFGVLVWVDVHNDKLPALLNFRAQLPGDGSVEFGQTFAAFGSRKKCRRTILPMNVVEGLLQQVLTEARELETAVVYYRTYHETPEDQQRILVGFEKPETGEALVKDLGFGSALFLSDRHLVLGNLAESPEDTKDRLLSWQDLHGGRDKGPLSQVQLYLGPHSPELGTLWRKQGKGGIPGANATRVRIRGLPTTIPADGLRERLVSYAQDIASKPEIVRIARIRRAGGATLRDGAFTDSALVDFRFAEEATKYALAAAQARLTRFGETFILSTQLIGPTWVLPEGQMEVPIDSAGGPVPTPAGGLPSSSTSPTPNAGPPASRQGAPAPTAAAAPSSSGWSLFGSVSLLGSSAGPQVPEPPPPRPVPPPVGLNGLAPPLPSPRQQTAGPAAFGLFRQMKRPADSAKGGAPKASRADWAQTLPEEAEKRGLFGPPMDSGVVDLTLEPGQRALPEPLSEATLAAAPPGRQKELLGEQLRPRVAQAYPDIAAEITDVLLGLDNPELLQLLASEEALSARVEEARVHWLDSQLGLDAMEAEEEGSSRGVAAGFLGWLRPKGSSRGRSPPKGSQKAPSLSLTRRWFGRNSRSPSPAQPAVRPSSALKTIPAPRPKYAAKPVPPVSPSTGSPSAPPAPRPPADGGRALSAPPPPPPPAPAAGGSALGKPPLKAPTASAEGGFDLDGTYHPQPSSPYVEAPVNASPQQRPEEATPAAGAGIQ